MRRALAVSVLLLLCSCTEDVQIGEKTKLGAAAGGALGAGLGAIVGSQVGDPGAGLILGGAAGAAASAAIGDSYDMKEAELDRQEAILKRQQANIDAQRRNLDEMRRKSANSDVRASVGRGIYENPTENSVRSSRDSYNYREITPKQQVATRDISSEGYRETTAQVAKVEEKTAQKDVNRPSSIFGPPNTGALWKANEDGSTEAMDKGKALKNEEKVAEKTLDVEKVDTSKQHVFTEEAVTDGETTALIPTDTTSNSSECAQAEKEVYNASNTSDTSSKLVFYRRALRLCPSNAQYHVSLGDLYRSLNRTSDAKYEYNEALKLDPGLNEVKDKITRLDGTNSERY